MQCHIKVDRVLDGPEAAAFLRKLADHLENNKLVVGDTEVEIVNPIAIDELLDVDGDKKIFDLKLEYRQNVEELIPSSDTSDKGGSQERDPKLSLKKLKKRMAKSFKTILDSLQGGEMPKIEQVVAFCGDSDVMTDSMKAGEEHFDDFKSKCKELLECVEKADLEAAKNAAGSLNQMRKDCHAAYK
jgi:XXXCH domain-containing protein